MESPAPVAESLWTDGKLKRHLWHDLIIPLLDLLGLEMDTTESIGRLNIRMYLQSPVNTYALTIRTTEKSATATGRTSI